MRPYFGFVLALFLTVAIAGTPAFAGKESDSSKSSSSDEKPVKEEFKEIGHAFKNGGRAVGHIFKKSAKAVGKALDGDGSSSKKKSD